MPRYPGTDNHHIIIAETPGLTWNLNNLILVEDIRHGNEIYHMLAHLKPEVFRHICRRVIPVAGTSLAACGSALDHRV